MAPQSLRLLLLLRAPHLEGEFHSRYRRDWRASKGPGRGILSIGGTGGTIRVLAGAFVGAFSNAVQIPATLTVIGIPVAFWLILAWMFSPQIVMNEPYSIRQSLGVSVRRTRHRLGHVASYAVVVWVPIIVLVGFSFGIDDRITRAIWSATILTLGLPFVAVALTLYYYRFLLSD